jgi:hypothetical protein
LRDIEYLNFIDRNLACPAISFEENATRYEHAKARRTLLAGRNINVDLVHGNFFEFRRESSNPHLFFIDLEGVCAWADYSRQFGNMLVSEAIREGDTLIVTSHLGHNPGWRRVFATFDGEYRMLGVTDVQKKKEWYKRAHPSFTLFRALEYASLTGELRIRHIGCVEYRDTSPMAVYGYVLEAGRTVFGSFVTDSDAPYFALKKGFVDLG